MRTRTIALDVLALAAFLAAAFAVAFSGAWFTMPSIPTWYADLNKPEWTPPNWLFGPVWTGLYALMAVAAWRVWRAGGGAVPLTWEATKRFVNSEGGQAARRR